MSNFKQSCLILNKPSGLASNEALKKVKKKLNIKKAGFSGTLDPLASGILIIFFNKATKLCSYFLNSDKCYDATIRLGQISTTGDLDGDIVNQSKDILNLKESDLNFLEEKFKGKIKQVPPMFSALKHNGIPLYKYAREGITIERQSREVVIHDIKLDLINANHIAMSVCCSKGTYIRTLAEQLGEDIGSGALLSKLVRTKINNISLSDSISLDEFLSKTINELKDNYIVNVDKLFNDVKSYIVSNEDKFKIQNGNKLKVNHQPCEIIKIYDADKSFLGIGKISDNFELLPKKILV